MRVVLTMPVIAALMDACSGGDCMAYVLMVMVYLSPSSAAAALSSAEYNTQQACEQAKAAVVQSYAVGNFHAVATCTPKG